MNVTSKQAPSPLFGLHYPLLCDVHHLTARCWIRSRLMCLLPELLCILCNEWVTNYRQNPHSWKWDQNFPSKCSSPLHLCASSRGEVIHVIPLGRSRETCTHRRCLLLKSNSILRSLSISDPRQGSEFSAGGHPLPSLHQHPSLWLTAISQVLASRGRERGKGGGSRGRQRARFSCHF